MGPLAFSRDGVGWGGVMYLVLLSKSLDLPFASRGKGQSSFPSSAQSQLNSCVYTHE